MNRHIKIIKDEGRRFLFVVLTVVISAIFLVFNIAYAFSESLYLDMRFPTDIFCMLSVAQKENRLINRNPAIFTSEDRDLLLSDSNVLYASSYTLMGLENVSSNGETIDIGMLCLVDPDFFKIMDITPLAGDFDIKRQCVIGFQLAQNHRILPGDILTIQTQEGKVSEVMVAGVMNELPSQKFRTFLSSFNSSIIALHGDWQDDDRFLTIFLSLNAKGDRDVRNISDRLEDALNRGYSSSAGSITQYERIVVQNRLDIKSTLNVMYSSIYGFIYIMTALVVIICLLGVYSKVSLMLIRSRQDLAILKRIGATDRMLAKLLLPQFMMIIVSALFLALLISTVVQIAACMIMSFPLVADLKKMGIIVAASLLFMFLSTLASLGRVVRKIR